jgi:Flp pilus assembly pilin Flp
MATASITHYSIASSLNRQRAQGMVEYSFILVLIALVVVVMLITTGGQIRNMYSDITYTLHNQAGL